MEQEAVCGIPQWNRRDAVSLLILIGAGLLVNFPIVFTGQLPLDEDSLLFFYPLRALHQDSALGFWDPYLFCGFPREANPQSQLLYFPNLIFFLVSIPTGFTLLIIGHFLVGGGLLYLLLRGLNLNRSASLFGSLTFLLSAFWRCKITNLGLLEGICWVPGALYFYLLGLETCSIIPLGVSMLLLSLVILAGVPHTVVYTLIIFMMITPAYGWGKIRSCLFSGCGFGITVLGAIILSSGVWYPALLYSPETQRTHLVLSDALVGSLRWSEIWKAFFGGLSQPEISRCDPWEGTCYVGITALIMVFIGWNQIPKKLRYGLTAIILFAVVCTLGKSGGLFPILYRWVPGWNFLNLPNRSLLMAAIVLPIMAAYGFQSCFRLKTFTPRYRMLLILLILLGIGISAYFFNKNPWAWKTLVDSAMTRTFLTESISDSAWSFLILGFWSALTGIILILFFFKLLRNELAIILLLLLIFAQSMQYTQRLFLETTAGTFFNPPGTARILKEKYIGNEIFRICGYAPLIDNGSDVRSRYIRPAFMHRLPEVYGLHEIQGYDPMYPRRYAELVRAFSDPSRATDPTRTIRLAQLTPGLLKLLGVRYVVGFPGQEVSFTGRGGEIHGAGILENSLKSPKTVESITFRWLLAGVPFAPQGAEVGRVRIHRGSETIETFPVRAGMEIANYVMESDNEPIQHRPALEYRWFPIPQIGGYRKVRQYAATFTLSRPAEIDKVSIESILPQGSWVILEIDLQTTDHWGLKPITDAAELPIYENPYWRPPAYLTRTIVRFENVREMVKIINHLPPEKPLPVFFPTQEEISLETPPIPTETNNKTALHYQRIDSDHIGISTESQNDAYLVVIENYSPNWNATVDDKPVRIQRADHAFMALPVLSGKHEIRLEYRSKPFYYACSLAGSTLTIILVVLWMFPRKWILSL